MILRLPSGRHVVLTMLKGDEWTCEYVGATDARGEVVFRVSWLRDKADLLTR